MWKMYFDGASSWEGFKDGVLFVSPSRKTLPYSFRLQFEMYSAINVCEYKALALGLETARKLKIVNLIVYGDVELIIKQIKQIYQDKHPRMRAYRNLVWDLIENFFLTFNIHAIPRHENQQVDSLVVATSTFQTPDVPKIKYEVEMRYKPSIHDNVKHWQVFEDDQQIKNFLEMIDEFSATHIDQENENENKHLNKIYDYDLKFQNMISNHKMMVLRNNQIPKGLVPLEKLFDKDDIVVKLMFILGLNK
jgi:ribonuclease HI